MTCNISCLNSKEESSNVFQTKNRKFRHAILQAVAIGVIGLALIAAVPNGFAKEKIYPGFYLKGTHHHCTPGTENCVCVQKNKCGDFNSKDNSSAPKTKSSKEKDTVLVDHNTNNPVSKAQDKSKTDDASAFTKVLSNKARIEALAKSAAANHLNFHANNGQEDLSVSSSGH